MKIKFQFNSRSRGQGVLEAINIAKKCGGVLDNKFYVIEFDNHRDKKLGRLYSLVGSLKGSVILVNDGEPINAVKFFSAVYCQDKLLCKGACRHFRLGFQYVDQFVQIHSPNIEDGVLKTSSPALFRFASNFLEPISDNQFKFNKQFFLDSANIDLAMEKLFCEKYDFSKFTDYVDALPSVMELVSADDLQDFDEDLFEDDEDIALVLTESVIDNSLPFNSILRCSSAISLLSRFPKPSRIADSDIKIYSVPEVKKILLVKLIVNENKSSTEEHDNEEEMNFLITEEQGFFMVKNELFELKFQIYEESDPTIEGQYRNLRKL